MSGREAGVRTLEHPGREELCIDRVLVALADPVRRTIVRSLAEQDHEQACVELELPVGKSTRSHHFRILREAGVIRQQYRGASIMNSLRRDDLAHRFPGLLDAVLQHPSTSRRPAE